MEKRKRNIIITVILILVLIVLYFPYYSELGSGDIMSGPSTLTYPTLGSKWMTPLCALGGGKMDKQVKGWSAGYNYTCIVKSKIICGALLGKYYSGADEEEKELFTKDGMFFGPNCKNCCYR